MREEICKILKERRTWRIMAVCPLDYRYGREEVKKIFSEEGRLNYMLRVELSLIKAHANIGNVPNECAEIVERSIENVRIERVKEIENEIKHDVMAMVKAISELSGDCGKYIHLGATSNDIIDTATALQLKDFIKILEDDLQKIEDVLERMAERYRNTIMLGRTHGQAAVPITFGLKMANYLAEILRHHERLEEIKKRILVGKMMGAVGTGASFGKDAMKIQKFVMENLNLGHEESPTQIIARDRYVEFISYLAGIATSLERFATEIRNLQRSEIDEVHEYFDTSKQVGSSTMAQKKNPIKSENICGLARVLRGLIIPMHESTILWHERDLTNSSAERFIIPHTCIIVDDILNKMADVFSNLEVNEERMMENLRNHEEIMAENVIMYLVEHGFGRQEAHEKVRKIAMREGKFRENLLGDDEIGEMIKEDIDYILNPENYLGCKDEIIDEIIEKRENLGVNFQRSKNK